MLSLELLLLIALFIIKDLKLKIITSTIAVGMKDLQKMLFI